MCIPVPGFVHWEDKWFLSNNLDPPLLWLVLEGSNERLLTYSICQDHHPTTIIAGFTTTKSYLRKKIGS